MVIMNSQKSERGGVGRRRLCDFCGEAMALVYCRADSAKLCLACDRQVHSTNQLFTKHTRWLLCDACDTTPATIFCFTDTSVLCQNCDWENHTNCSLPAVHDRRPLEGFGGCPSVSELLGFLGFEELSKKALLFGDDSADPGEINDNNGDNIYGLSSDLLVWETPSVVSLDDLIMSNDSSSAGRSLQSIMGVPPLPKNRNATCGRHKEDILFQLREMSKLEPNTNDGQAEIESLIGLPSLVSEQNCQLGQQDKSQYHNGEQILHSPYEAGALQWCGDKVDVANQDFSSDLLDSYIEMNHLVPDKDTDIAESPGQINGSHDMQSHSPGTETLQILPRVSIRELNSQQRDSAISRYKEKKKTRRYDKQIRYETRKARAESRIRIKGRFAKMDR
ncbi:hypothetical protein ACH5RR_010744 [Cinchona calisaya]|uniref:Uncharacterized protein n=1 Tax=Cinchona calisaya TaxID=153742 RepID=A0ABD3AJS3_9GENT